MLRTRACLALLLIALAAAPAATPKKLHVLFIGNSYTYVNELPEVVKAMAHHAETEFTYAKEVAGGATLEKHWNDGKAVAKVREKGWDYVVLQEQSGRPIADRDAMAKYAKLFDAEIRKAGAKTVLFMTWAREDKADQQAALTKAYRDVGEELKATVVPAGEAWKAARAEKNPPTLHVADKSHPAPSGTYLAACLFHRVLTGGKAEGLPRRIEHNGKALVELSATEAHRLQKVADETPLDK